MAVVIHLEDLNIGDNIKRIRIWKQLGQKELSEISGISQGSLSKIESGKDFLCSKLIKISQALGCDPSDLISFDANKVTFNLIGDKAKGMVINQGNGEKQLQEINQILKEENTYLRKMLEKAINKTNKK